LVDSRDQPIPGRLHSTWPACPVGHQSTQASLARLPVLCTLGPRAEGPDGLKAGALGCRPFAPDGRTRLEGKGEGRASGCVQGRVCLVQARGRLCRRVKPSPWFRQGRAPAWTQGTPALSPKGPRLVGQGAWQPPGLPAAFPFAGPSRWVRPSGAKGLADQVRP
jgi:hypothetical protein